VYYSGTEDNWNSISIKNEGNDPLLNANIHFAKETVKHVINSDNDNNHYFYFNENEEIEDLVYSKSSTEYNPRLAHFLACMARSAYTQDLVVDNYDILGIKKHEQYHYNGGDYNAAYTIGKKQLDDGSLLVMVTIRGTNDLSEWMLTNFNLGRSTMQLSAGFHLGFLASSNEVYQSLEDFLGGNILTNDVTYVITGHSLGAAVGNILAAKLDAYGVPNQNVYDYNFACPNVGMGSDDISVWNDHGKHNNIINVGNNKDIVSHEPGIAVESLSLSNRELCLLNGWKKWKRFGQSYWFDNGIQLWFQLFGHDAHDMATYIDYLEKLNDESHFTASEYVVQSFSAHCPVDVVIYDSQGNPIAGTTNNEPNYYGFKVGEKAVIFVDGDEKTFHIPENEKVTVRLIATDNGEMDYSVGLQNLTDGETLSDKWFNSVQLTTGKEMLGKTVNVLDEDTKTITQDEKLLLADLSTEILENGAETGYTVRYILGDSDNSGKIDMVDATSVQRKLAGILTPFADDVLLHGDADGNGELEIIDVTAIQSYLADILTPYLIGVEVV